MVCAYFYLGARGLCGLLCDGQRQAEITGMDSGRCQYGYFVRFKRQSVSYLAHVSFKPVLRLKTGLEAL